MLKMAANEDRSSKSKSKLSSDDEDYVRVKNSQILYSDLSVTLVRPQQQLTPSSTSAREQLLRSVDEHLLFLFESRKLCDLVVSNGQDKLHIHRVVLAAQSPKYRQLFSDTSSPLPSEVTVSSQDLASTPGVLAQVLRYLYTGEMTLTEGNVAEALDLAAQLDVGSLLDAGRQLLLKYDEGNVLKYLRLALKHDFQDLRAQLAAFAQRHFAAVSQSPDFPRLTVDALTDVLTGEEPRLQDAGETGVLRAAVRWIRAAEDQGGAKKDNRMTAAPAVLRCVRFERVPPHDLMDIVEKDAGLAEVPEVSLMLYEAYKHHALGGQEQLDQDKD